MELTAGEYVSMDSVCHSIVLREDTLLEVTETIVLELNSINSFVIISQSSAVFNILDTVRITQKCVVMKNISVYVGLYSTLILFFNFTAV